ncbi:MAG: hypothetical protein ABSD62_03085 [Candidatus Limnocylindrales bacterium]|jgi:hypothetical protein
MSPRKGAQAPVVKRGLPPEFSRIPGRRILIVSPTVQIRLGPGDRALVSPGNRVVAGSPIAERTCDPEFIDVGRLNGPANGSGDGNGRGSSNDAQQERRRAPAPGKWWVGGDERRGKATRREGPRRLAGTLLYEIGGRWSAAAGERHERIESPTTGDITGAANCIGITMKVAGVGIPAAVAGGQPSRGYLDVPRLVDGELRDTALDMGRSGAVVVAGGRVSAEALTRARAMSIRGMVAGSLGQAELRDLAASEARQRAGLHLAPPFGVLGLDGHQRRPIASPIMALLAALAGREVAIITEPPMLVLDVIDVPLPELPPDWVRVRSGKHAGREGRWLSSAGLHRFRAGIHLEAANIRLGDDLQPTVIALADLERFIL